MQEVDQDEVQKDRLCIPPQAGLLDQSGSFGSPPENQFMTIKSYVSLEYWILFLLVKGNLSSFACNFGDTERKEGCGIASSQFY